MSDDRADPASDGPMRFDDEAIRRILARARDPEDPSAQPPGIDADALVAAAEEVGYDPIVVRDSIALERLGPPPSPPTVLDRLAGPGDVVVDGNVDQSAGDVVDVAAAWLERSHRMSVRRLGRRTVVARRRADVGASLGRVISELRGDGRVGRLAAVRLDAVELSPVIEGGVHVERSALRVTGDRRPGRRRRLTVGGLLGGTAAATAAVGIAESFVAWPLFAVVSGGLGVAAVVGGRRHAERVESQLEMLVDNVATGREPAGALRRAASAARRSVRG